MTLAFEVRFSAEIPYEIFSYYRMGQVFAAGCADER
jgi:hypothetical protein